MQFESTKRGEKIAFTPLAHRRAPVASVSQWKNAASSLEVAINTNYK